MANERYLMISEAPTDPEEKKEWSYRMLRIQVAMWVDDGAKCAVCKIPYKNVDDWIERDPINGGKEWDEMFVDKTCWPKFELNRH